MHTAKAPCSYVICWDLVVSEGSGDASSDDLRATPLRQAPPEELNPLITFFDS